MLARLPCPMPAPRSAMEAMEDASRALYRDITLLEIEQALKFEDDPERRAFWSRLLLARTAPAELAA